MPHRFRPDADFGGGELEITRAVFEFEGIAGHQRDYIAWLFGVCAADGVEPSQLMDADAIDILAERLRTPRCT